MILCAIVWSGAELGGILWNCAELKGLTIVLEKTSPTGSVLVIVKTKFEVALTKISSN